MVSFTPRMCFNAAAAAIQNPPASAPAEIVNIVPIKAGAPASATPAAASDSNRDSRLSVGRRRALRRQLSVPWAGGGARAAGDPVSLFRASYRGSAIRHWSQVEPMAPSTSHFTLSLNALSVLEI